MDRKQFLSSIVGYLAWPAVVAYLLYLLRGQLAGLAERLEEVTLPGGASAKFRKQLAKAAEKAEKVDTEAPDEAPPAVLPEEPLLAVSPPPTLAPEADNIASLAQSFPAAAVVETFKSIEALLIDISVYLPETSKRRSTHVVIQRLLDHNKITENAYELYQSLREARNSAAHAITTDSITTREAIDYHNKAEVLKRVLRRALDGLRAEQ